MEKEKTIQCIEICREAFATLEDSKRDCKDVVESAIDALCGVEDGLPPKIRKGILIEHKDEIRGIKKIAKALATGKLESVSAESAALTDIVSELGLQGE